MSAPPCPDYYEINEIGTQEEIDELEKELQVTLPDSFKQFYLTNKCLIFKEMMDIINRYSDILDKEPQILFDDKEFSYQDLLLLDKHEQTNKAIEIGSKLAEKLIEMGALEIISHIR